MRSLAPKVLLLFVTVLLVSGEATPQGNSPGRDPFNSIPSSRGLAVDTVTFRNSTSASVTITLLPDGLHLGLNAGESRDVPCSRASGAYLEQVTNALHIDCGKNYSVVQLNTGNAIIPEESAKPRDH